MLSTVQFSSFADFINMGGYAFNVWAVYGLFAVF
jgi:heme exporter protein D